MLLHSRDWQLGVGDMSCWDFVFSSALQACRSKSQFHALPFFDDNLYENNYGDILN